MRRISITIVCLATILLGCTTVSSLPPIPDHMSNPSPYNGEEDVEITAKGVQTCINITVDGGCTVNITFYWYNWTDWPAVPAHYEVYGYYPNISTSGRFCAYDVNVSCATEGDPFTEYHYWMVKANFTCQQGGASYETFYGYYKPQLCPLFYIYPPNNSTGICSCCDSMCIGITNELGHLMNLSFYRNDSQNLTYYVVNRYTMVPNGTYCFCIDGHIDDIYYPMRYNETYNWYINVTDVVTGDYNISNIYNFTTAQNRTDCICLNSSNVSSLCDDCGKLGMPGVIGLVGIFGLLGYFLTTRKRRKL